MLKRLFLAMTITGALAVAGTAVTAAAPSPNGPGQPNASCEESSTHPAGFASDGFAVAEGQYAGAGDGSTNANSPHAVSQYDVACLQLSSR
jgi:hypothetical protein